MCNAQVIRWFDRHLAPDEVRGARVLEVGSRDVNGSLRGVIMAKGPRQYLGLDLEAGPGVDVVSDICSSGIRAADPFDLVVSSCCLEHVQNLAAAVHNIKALCRLGGWIVLAVPDIWPRHDYPHDYWRIGPAALESLLGDCTPVFVERVIQDDRHSLVYGKFHKPFDFQEVAGPLYLQPPLTVAR